MTAGIEVGETYSSPKYDRYIQVLGIDKETPTEYTLAIFWVTKDTLQTEAGDLVVPKLETATWTLMEL